MIEPLVRAVDPELTRVRLAAPSGLVVNAYVLRYDDVVALIDSGFACTVDQLVVGLAEQGLSPGDLTHVLYTHTHYDHMGGGAALAEACDAVHILPEGTGAFFRHFFTEAPTIPDYPEGLALTLPAGPQAETVVNELRAAPAAPLRGENPGARAQIREVAAGDHFRLGRRTFRVLATPGHDRYHVSYHEIEAGRLYVGDVVLASPVPLSPWHGDHAGTWLASLCRIEALGDPDARAERVTRLIPGHGMPTSLVVPSVHRARTIFLTQFDAVREALSGGRPVHPVDAVEAVLTRGGARNVQRTGAVVSTGLQVLLELVETGYAEQLQDGRFVATRKIPVWTEVWPDAAK